MSKLYRYRWYRRLSRCWDHCISTPWYELKCRAWHRFNVVYIETLTPTWHDRDQVLLHACFQILTDFVDREKPFDWFNIPESPSKAHWEEILRLYAWWTVDRPARKEENVACREQLEVRKQRDREDEEMLIRLIKVRKKLWT